LWTTEWATILHPSYNKIKPSDIKVKLPRTGTRLEIKERLDIYIDFMQRL
jgi:hypothetical protein